MKPPISHSQLVWTARNLVQQYARLVGKEHILQHGMCFDTMYEEIIYTRYGIVMDESRELGTDSKGTKILGEYFPRENIAAIDLSQKNGDPRRTFTRYHEVVGHGVLQGRWLRENMKNGSIITTSDDLMHHKTVNALEQQANLCAALTAAPDWLVDAAIALTFRPTKFFVFIGPSEYSLNPVRGIPSRSQIAEFPELCRNIARFIQPWFDGLSIESLGYRVQKSRLVRDQSKQPAETLRVAI